MSRTKKKHICSCGEEFNHGIGLRKHQRQTGHKGSNVVEVAEEDESPIEAAAERATQPKPEPPPPPPAAPTPPPPPPAAPTPPPPPPTAPTPPPPPPAPQKTSVSSTSKPVAPASPPNEVADDDESERTVAISRAMNAIQQKGALQEPASSEPSHHISAFEHNRQKLSLVGKGLTVIAQQRARNAGLHLKRSARSGADIFQEALKIAAAILLLLSIPAFTYWWWTNQQNPAVKANSAATNAAFSQNEATAARDVVLKYLDALAKKKDSNAYAELSLQWRSELSLASFQEALTNIQDIRWAIDEQKLIDNTTAEVGLRLAFLEAGKSKKFQARFRLTLHEGSWKIDRLELLASPSAKHQR